MYCRILELVQIVAATQLKLLAKKHGWRIKNQKQYTDV